MTVIMTRIVTPNPGHFDDTLQFTKKRVAVLKEAYGLDISINARVGGPVGQLNLAVYYDSMAELEETRRKIIDGVAEGKIPQSEPGTIKSVEDLIWMKL